MDDKIIKVQGQLFFTYNMNNLNKNKWNEKKPDDWRYEVHLGQLDSSTVKRLEEELNVKAKTKEKDDHGIGVFIRCKSKFPFTAEDMDGNSIDPADIGNGTVAVVSLRSYEHPMSGQHGWAPRIVGGKSVSHVVVKELVKREPKPEEETL
jgi:hypothetical protein